MRNHRAEVKGSAIDEETRCTHYHSRLDIIAIKFYCCMEYYPCHLCHEEHASHPAAVWPKEKFDEKAVLCGGCGSEWTVREYAECDSKCPECKMDFNPGCSLHAHLYFEEI
ncbi:hypothetical protein CEF21_18800 [Bacillus sp. FJAT-42376]|uniref:CHY zinc finger protein n=1 Tax=Bacillus sp. FJAT-42376 TaxID=2014076 RepID=UPI000F4F04FE|nr:CHY zinc finger protein [Bacillus sp. FJAT-42376]AZB44178.1 hypothetical protein CEF21_18800 [Bacillus sp. FJAT-42376]